MKIEDLQIELRPRSNAQALDLGFTLLRSHPGPAFVAFAVLWFPLIGATIVLTVLFPTLFMLWGLLPWWLRPLLERAPLYVLSRKVFGASVTWQQAVRAWPSQLGGGWFGLLTWARLLSAGRALYQPVWQLEGARGRVASARREVLGRKNATSTAWFFGVVMFWLEAILSFGMMGLIAMFVGDASMSNPFTLLFKPGEAPLWWLLTSLFMAGVAGAIFAPIYTACGFTLYLNRRASLEAWDIEMQLRQIQRPASVRSRPRAASAAALAVSACLLLMLGASLPGDSHAAPSKTPPPACKAPEPESLPARGPVKSPAQAKLRKQVDALYLTPELGGYECIDEWHLKKRWQTPDKKPDLDEPDLPRFDFSGVAGVMQVLLIAVAIGIAAWLLFRYRHFLPGMPARPVAVAATEVAGLDIRPDSLPAKVGDEARRLWAAGERRTALGLLYRATLARLVRDHRLHIGQGATEGDCLRVATEAHRGRRVNAERLAIATTTTALWLAAAYGNRWPSDAAVFDLCAQWDAEYDRQQEVAA
jgi:hypothetical protein